MELYLLFLIMAVAAILRPGPGVMLTLTNSIRYGVYESLGGIAGISLGALVVAAVSATGLGLILTASAAAYTILKYAGAVYLIWLGIKMWRGKSSGSKELIKKNPGIKIRFWEGFTTQLLNPKAIFFFMSVFPQFINSSENYELQFLFLALTYSVLVAAIHTLYSITASRAKKWLNSKRGEKIVNRTGGSVFIFFGLSLAVSKN